MSNLDQSSHWFYEVQGGHAGPITIEALRELLRRGTVSNDTLVWNKSLGSWEPVRDTDVAVATRDAPDVWYYADENRKVEGPLTLQVLKQTLQTFPITNASDVLIWRDGFQDWTPARDVVELKAQTPAPPPLPANRSGPPDVSYLNNQSPGTTVGYVGKVLEPGERIIYRAHLHWIIFLQGLIPLIFVPMFHGNGPLIMLTMLAMFFLFLRALITRITTEIAVTNGRVILKEGFINRNTIEINAAKVESVDVQQPLFGRLLNYGTVVVRGTGSSANPLHNVDDPLALRRAIAPLAAS
jgi:hypothetical protein